MHELGLIKDLLSAVEKRTGPGKLKNVSRIIIEISLFGGIKKEHFIDEFNLATKGMFLYNDVLEIKEVPFGAPLTLVDVWLDN
ncbi:MAG: hypothetical protein COV72_04460 [Candidatus Omnitrophica bacterium CG11_big_fil_rev_8_21_14_0_20_42_13]|uniref:Hydrogenase maturation nickel metallochaperone HypA n=1 Tax=Candidatus Ghiorseimicrobium undicola TaxID=1974746 RepID=A0A2H0LXS7_9BACT|nr:MAG: hypothetical protein COV72_04460 [Candidatus Omnitrophica bacterium CG11_big_fil_rev_8_21_14_0_20_42_13]